MPRMGWFAGAAAVLLGGGFGLGWLLGRMALREKPSWYSTLPLTTFAMAKPKAEREAILTLADVYPEQAIYACNDLVDLEQLSYRDQVRIVQERMTWLHLVSPAKVPPVLSVTQFRRMGHPDPAMMNDVRLDRVPYRHNALDQIRRCRRDRRGRSYLRLVALDTSASITDRVRALYCYCERLWADLNQPVQPPRLRLPAVGGANAQGTGGAPPIPVTLADLTPVLALLRSPSPAVRVQATRSLAYGLTDVRGESALRASVAAEKVPSVRSEMVEALAYLKSGHAVGGPR